MFNIVADFEAQIAEYFNAPYAVAVDCCTHAIELCLRHTEPKSVQCPSHTYISVPFTFTKLNLNWNFNHEHWQKYYWLKGTNIIDAAVLWEEDSYVPNTLMCLSFQFKKHLSLGRGGAILCSNKKDYDALKKMSYDGRMPNVPWADQDINSIGYHYYMTPETAKLGLDKLSEAKSTPAKLWTWQDYPYLPQFKVFTNV